MKKCILIVTLILFQLSIVRGQVLNYIFTNFKVSDGLPCNECYDVIQDEQGYIWIFTDIGVARFDGQGYTLWHRGWTDGQLFSTRGL